MVEPHFNPDVPIRLLPVDIPKPWGREIWFTGIEARGESRVGTAEASLPLSEYLALAPERICQGRDLILLKILDPRPDPVLGELYLEVHAEKQEVYVVTAVDRSCWPDGRGRIRYGINQTLRRAHASDEAFRAAFLNALGRYESVRRQIDDGVPDLEAEEAQARTATVSYTEDRTLTVGDVIRVPTWVPHSLQQGVRVIEFQTPTYERFILSSSQKVLTQDRWDSAQAIARMQLDLPQEDPPEPVAAGVDRIVRFDDFAVWRAALASGASLDLPPELPYALIFCIDGRIALGARNDALTLSQGEAALIPGSAVGEAVKARDDCLLLAAAPGL